MTVLYDSISNLDEAANLILCGSLVASYIISRAANEYDGKQRGVIDNNIMEVDLDLEDLQYRAGLLGAIQVASLVPLART